MRYMMCFPIITYPLPNRIPKNGASLSFIFLTFQTPLMRSPIVLALRLFVLPFSVSCIAILQFSYVAICCMCPLFTLGIHLHLFRPPALATRPVPFRFHFRNGGYRPLFEVFKQIRERDALFQFAFEGVFHQFPYQAPAFEPLAKLPRDSNAAYSLYPFFTFQAVCISPASQGLRPPYPQRVSDEGARRPVPVRVRGRVPPNPAPSASTRADGNVATRQQRRYASPSLWPIKIISNRCRSCCALSDCVRLYY